MAEGWDEHLLHNVIDACSAGTDPHGLNPLAVRTMAEAGVDIASYTSKSIDACDPAALDLVITVCGHAQEHCPVFVLESLRTRVIHHGFDDPPKLAAGAASDDETMPHYSRVRDEIRKFVESIPALLQSNPLHAKKGQP